MNPALEVWVIAEITASGPVSATYELLGTALELAETRNAVTAVVALGHDISRWSGEFRKRGAAKLYLADAPELAGFQDETYAAIIASLAKQYRPEIILGAASVRGRSLMPRAAVMLETGLTADCTGLAIQPDTGKTPPDPPRVRGKPAGNDPVQHFPANVDCASSRFQGPGGWSAR